MDQVVKSILPVVALSLFLAACSQTGTSTDNTNFRIKFSYGANARNVLNTFDNTYTKDLVLNGVVTVPFTLSDSAVERISSKMTEIGFFKYPDTFKVGTYQTTDIRTPHPTYIFHVVSGTIAKNLYWCDSVSTPDTSAVKLRGLIDIIEEIVASNPNYSQLPPARGGTL